MDIRRTPIGSISRGFTEVDNTHALFLTYRFRTWKFYRSVARNIVSFLLFESVIFLLLVVCLMKEPTAVPKRHMLTIIVRIKKKFCLSLCQSL